MEELYENRVKLSEDPTPEELAVFICRILYSKKARNIKLIKILNYHRLHRLASTAVSTGSQREKHYRGQKIQKFFFLYCAPLSKIFWLF